MLMNSIRKYALVVLFKELGRGAYGIVYKARDRHVSGPWRAVKKIIKKSIKNPNSIKN